MASNTGLNDGLLSPRRRLEQLVSNPGCETNVASALLKVGVSQVAKVRGLAVHSGLSKFAYTRGKKFESYILRKKADGTTPLGTQLVRKGLIESQGSLELIDLHGQKPVTKDGPDKFDQSRASSVEFLRSIARESNFERTAIATGFRFITQQIQPPGDVEIDLVFISFNAELAKWTIRIGEVKVYPDRAGFTDPGQLSTARAQAGLYRRLLSKFISALELEEKIEVLDRCFFVFTKATGAGVSVWANEDISEQDERAANALRLMQTKSSNERVAELAQDGVEQKEIVDYLAHHTETSYSETCWSFCELAEHCLRQLIAKDDALVLGREVKQELGEVSIERMLDLMYGTAEPNEAEADILERFEDARFAKEGD